jgi:transcriptional regulator with XRE-family HTH domain
MGVWDVTRLKELRVQRGWSGLQLSYKSRTAPTNISRAERGLMKFDRPALLRVADALGVDPTVIDPEYVDPKSVNKNRA